MKTKLNTETDEYEEIKRSRSEVVITASFHGAVTGS